MGILDNTQDNIETMSDRLKTDSNDSYLEREYCKECELLRKRSGMANVVCYSHGRKPNRDQVVLFDQLVSAMKLDLILKGNK